MKLFKLLAFFVVCLSHQILFAEDKVIAIPIPQISSLTQSSQMIKKEMPKSLDFLSTKIVGGVPASRNEFPEFAQLFVDGLDGFVYSVCGATLLTNNKVLTATHCTRGLASSRLYVLPNFYSFNDSITFSDLIPVSVKREHPNYQQTTQFNNDIAILTLSRASNTPTAKIFAGEDQLVGSTATVIGVGLTNENSTNPPQTVRKVDIPVVSNDVCKNSYGNSRITDVMMCAGLATGGKDTCQGDSGGPLWVDFEGQRVQAGIVSWGNGCARPNFYGVYSRTSSLIEFILQHAPDTEIIKETTSIVPVLQLLLFSDDAQTEIESPTVNCDGGELGFGDSITIRTTFGCRDASFAQQYYKSYTFSLAENERVSIKSLATLSAANNIDLYSGTGESITLLENATWSTTDGGSTFLIRDLVAGEYTIYIRTESPSIGISLTLTQYDCEATQIELDTPLTFQFEHNCKDLGVFDSYVKYHSFSWPTDGAVYITASAISNSSKLITLYRLEGNELTFIHSSVFAGANSAADIYRTELPSGDYIIKTVFLEENGSITLEVNAENCRGTDTILLPEQKTISYSEDCQTLRNQYETILDFNVSEFKKVIITSNKFFTVSPGDSAKLQYESELEENFEYIYTWSFGPFPEGYRIVTRSGTTSDQTITTSERSCSTQDISIEDQVNVSFSSLCRGISNNRYEDYRTFTLNSTQSVKITALSDQTGTGVSLYQGDELDNLILLANGSGDYDVPAEIEQNLSPGTYTIKSHADYSVYDFHLSLE